MRFCREHLASKGIDLADGVLLELVSVLGAQLVSRLATGSDGCGMGGKYDRGRSQKAQNVANTANK